MSRGLELTLSGLFREAIGVYLRSFPSSYARYKLQPVDFFANLETYKSVILDSREAIYRSAAAEVNRYLNTYAVHVNQSADEFKILYFLGRAIERHLVLDGYIEISQVHMFTMIGLLDYRLLTLGVPKPKLTKALTKLIKLNVFDTEMGKNGCYLTYKCVATTGSASTSSGQI